MASNTRSSSVGELPTETRYNRYLNGVVAPLFVSINIASTFLSDDKNREISSLTAQLVENITAKRAIVTKHILFILNHLNELYPSVLAHTVIVGNTPNNLVHVIFRIAIWIPPQNTPPAVLASMKKASRSH